MTDERRVPPPPSGTPTRTDSFRSEEEARAAAAEWGNPGTRSWKITAHPISWALLLITVLAILMTSLDGDLLNRTMPLIKDEFHLNDSQLGWINSVFFLGFVIGAYFFGIWSDRIGSGYRRGWTWAIAMAFAILGGCLTFGASTSFLLLLLWRIPMGISRGGSEPTNVAIIGEWWPKEHRGFALGVHHTGFPIGQFVVGPLLVLAMGASNNWRNAFLLIPLLAVIVIAGQLLVGTRKNEQKVFDFIDAHDQTRPQPELSVKTHEKVFDQILVAFRNHNARWIMLLAFLFLWGEAGATSFLTLQLTERGVSTAQAVVIAGASGLTGWIGQILWGTLSDHIGRKPALSIILIGWILSVAAMFFISNATMGWIILAFWGLFRNAPFPVVYAVLSDSVPKTSGSAMGVMIGTALGVSGMLASVVAGYMIQSFGWGIHYGVIVALLCLGFLPIAKVMETVHHRDSNRESVVA